MHLGWKTEIASGRLVAALDANRKYRIDNWGALAGHKPFRIELGLRGIGEADTIQEAKAMALAHAIVTTGQGRWL